VSISQLANGLIIALVVAVVGGVIAYLLGKNGTAQQAAFLSLTAGAERQSAKLENLQLLAGELSTSLGPVLRELEGLGVQIQTIDRDLTRLQEWRSSHEKWANESIARLDAALRTSRKTDTL
jgi:hypothetical protein